MAMNPKLSEGSILLYYPDIEEVYNRWRSYGRPIELTGYHLKVNALYVYNRRERTTGAQVPILFRPYLDALKIRTHTSHYGREAKYATAVGCRTKTLYEQVINLNDDIPAAFRHAFKHVKEIAEFDSRFFENEFVEEFLETRLNNKDKKFLLFPPAEKLQGFHSFKEIHQLEDNNFWADSKKYKQLR